MKNLNITKQVLLMLHIIICGGSLKAQNCNDVIFKPYKTEAVIYSGYSFPVNPKSDDWKIMNHSQRVSALQIPNDTLQNISTSRLLETCLYYPLNIDAFMNDDIVAGFKKIKSQFGMYQVNYHFQYYDEDSIKVYITLPEVNQGFYAYTNYMCHLKDGRINRIDMYFNENPKDTRHYVYDDKNRLIKAGGTHFAWEDDNVYMRYSPLPNGDTIVYGSVGEHIHPYYSLPYLLPTCSYFSSFGSYITQPLWKNMSECTEHGCYEYDSDGWVTYTYYITEDGNYQTFRNYEYAY